VQKQGQAFRDINVRWDEKLNWSLFTSSFIVHLIKKSVKHIIYLINKKVNQTKPNHNLLAGSSAKTPTIFSKRKRTKSALQFRVISHCIFLKITNALIPHKGGAPVSARPDCVKLVQTALDSSPNFSTTAEDNRDGLTSARCCNYSYMCS
jgi:hypothetical protein